MTTKEVMDKKMAKADFCPACSSNRTIFLFNKNKFPFRRCNNCELVFCSKIPDSKTLQEYYSKNEFCTRERSTFMTRLENKYFLMMFINWVIEIQVPYILKMHSLPSAAAFPILLGRRSACYSSIQILSPMCNMCPKT